MSKGFSSVPNEAPLHGIRVLDMSRLLPGPFCSQLLVDLGAEVIKIEDTAGGDYLRYFPPVCEDGSSAMFHSINRGKKSIALNLKKPAHRADFERLLAISDVLLESFRPGVLASLVASPSALLERFPHLVVCSISGYGQSGPLAQTAGHDLNYAARAGVLGAAKDLSAPLPVQVADLAGGAWPAALQIVAALHSRARTGRGSVIDVSMTDCVRGLLVMPLAAYSVDNTATVTNGADHLSGSMPAYQVYRTKGGGRLAVGSVEPKFWEPFVKAIGKPELSAVGWLKNDDVIRDMQAHLLTKTAGEWMQMLRDAKVADDVCVEEVITPEEAAKGHTFDVHVAAKVGSNIKNNGHTVASSASNVGRSANNVVQVVNPPLNMTGMRVRAEAGPMLGEHTEELLRLAKNPPARELRARL